jgi:carbonic anhydrase
MRVARIQDSTGLPDYGWGLPAIDLTLTIAPPNARKIRDQLKEPGMSRFILCCFILGFAGVPSFAQQTGTMKKEDSSHHAHAAKPAQSAQQVWADLMQGNERFIAGKPKARSLVPLRTGLAKGQRPKAMVLACSDSRVGPELIFDQSLGDLFVVRSAGNIADAIGVGSLEYAAEHLGSTVLVVMGHTKCGAVTAACSGEKMPTPNLQAIVDKIQPAVAKPGNDDALVEAAIKENVHQSAKDVLAASEVLRHFVDDGKLTVIEAEYELDTGKVVRLDK